MFIITHNIGGSIENVIIRNRRQCYCVNRIEMQLSNENILYRSEF